MRKVILVFLAVVLVISTFSLVRTGEAVEVEILDQSQDECTACEHVGNIEIGWNSWQSFVPTKERLSSVHVKIARTLDEVNPKPTEALINMTIEKPLGNVLALSILHWEWVPLLPFCQAEWHRFNIEPDLVVTAGQTYYIVLKTSEGYWYHWCMVWSGNPYPSGVSNFGGGADWTFRTFYPVVGGISVPVDKLALLTPYIALAAALVAVTLGAAYGRKRWLVPKL